MSACPLQSVLGDFEDAWIHLKDENAKREISLVSRIYSELQYLWTDSIVFSLVDVNEIAN